MMMMIEMKKVVITITNTTSHLHRSILGGTADEGGPDADLLHPREPAGGHPAEPPCHLPHAPADLPAAGCDHCVPASREVTRAGQ